MKRSTIILLCCSSMLFGCTSPKFSYQPEAATKESNLLVIVHRWWQPFSDPLMDQLANDLLKQNLDIQIARSKIDEARGLAQVVDAKFFPDIQVTATSERGNTHSHIDNPVRITQGGFDAVWEIDLFGQNVAQRDVASLRLNGTKAQLEAVASSMLAELIKAVICLRQAQFTVIEKKALVATQANLIKLIRSRTDSGLMDRTTLSKIQAEQAQTTTQIPLAQAELERAIYQIQKLMGRSTIELEKFYKLSNGLLVVPSVDKTFDITLDRILTRPDVRAARSNMLAAQSELTKAERDLWPKISIRSFFGLKDNSAVLPVATNPLWSLAANVSAPFLNFDRLRGAINVANARAKTAAIEYEQASITALQETKTAISDYLNAIKAIDTQKQVLQHCNTALHLATERYKSGIADRMEVIVAQTELSKAKLLEINHKAKAAIAYVRFYKALGVSCNQLS